MNKFKIGDKVFPPKNFGFRSDMVGIITHVYHGIDRRAGQRYSYQLEVSSTMSGPTFSPYIFTCFEEDLVLIEEKEETKKRKEQLRLKYIDIDPYGEENWED